MRSEENKGGRPRAILSSDAVRALYLSGQYRTKELIDYLGISMATFHNYRKTWNLKTLRIGISDTAGVSGFIYQKKGAHFDVSGAYDIIFAKLLCQSLGYRLKIVPDRFNQLFSDLDAGKIDLIASNVGWTKERSEKYGLSKPYGFFEQPVEFGLVFDPNRIDPIKKNFKELKVATMRGSICHKIIAEEEKLPQVSYRSFTTAETALEQNQVDCILGHKLPLIRLVQKRKLHFEPFRWEKNSPTCAVARKNDTDLIEKVNDSIQKINSHGLLADLSNHFLSGEYLSGLPANLKV